ncbi:hypothetical protein MJM43_30690, partial [Salmonella enterica subsp. enterica serovar Montevideo]|nr:hypothetical protein [Salmonella enterica subsp. enterica serovar Montevideo]
MSKNKLSKGQQRRVNANHTEQMHNALRQAQIKLPPVDFAFAVGHDVHRTVMQEDEIQIGT